jgi:hypothetical protein
MAAWPAVSYDGTVMACCNQNVIDGHAPDHLILGHAARDTWETIAERCRTRTALRAIRLYGPEFLAERFQPGCPTVGYCAACRRIGDQPDVLAGAAELVGTTAFAAMETLMTRGYDAAGPEAFARGHGIPEYAEMLTLGHKSNSGAPVIGGNQ